MRLAMLAGDGDRLCGKNIHTLREHKVSRKWVEMGPQQAERGSRLPCWEIYGIQSGLSGETEAPEGLTRSRFNFPVAS